MKLKNLLIAGASCVLTATIAVGGTLAYLTSQDSDVNVMTTGSVYIEQIEQERDENGKLVDFSQAKPLYPAVGSVAWNDDKININGHDYSMFGEKLKNAVDKIVSVKNTGKSDAYIRTWIAIEDPFTTALVGVNVGGVGYTQTPWATATIDGVQYSVSCFTYDKALKAGETSLPSLLQVYLNSKTTNEDVALLGDTHEILAFSQGVQTAGFADAKTALDTAFGTEHPWVDGVDIPVVVSDADGLVKALTAGEDVVLTADITLTAPLAVEKAVNIDLNGNDLGSVGFELKNGGTIKNGAIKSADNTENFLFHLLVSGGTLTMENVDVSITDSMYKGTGFNSSSQACGIRVENAEVVLNDCDVKVHNDTNNVYFVQGWAVDLLNAEFTMNGGSITALCEKGTAPDTTGLDDPAYACALGADGISTATLNDVTVTTTYFGEVFDWGNESSHLTLNTTDKNITADDFTLWWTATITVNHIN